MDSFWFDSWIYPNLNCITCLSLLKVLITSETAHNKRKLNKGIYSIRKYQTRVDVRNPNVRFEQPNEKWFSLKNDTKQKYFYSEILITPIFLRSTSRRFMEHLWFPEQWLGTTDLDYQKIPSFLWKSLNWYWHTLLFYLFTLCFSSFFCKTI